MNPATHRPIRSALPPTHGATPDGTRHASRSGTVHTGGKSGYSWFGIGRVQTLCDMNLDPNPTGAEVTCPYCIEILATIEREKSALAEMES